VVVFISALLFQIKVIKRAFKLDKPFRDDVKVYGGCFYGGMTKKLTDCIKVRSSVKGVGRKGVTKGVNTAGFCYTGFFLA
jgi:hypothetical protein